MADVRFYRCSACKKVVALVGDELQDDLNIAGMELLVAGSVDAAREKHVPAVSREGAAVSVQVGSVEHPMQEAHFIEFIAVQAGRSVQIAYLAPGEAPAASFTVPENEAITVYEYCNLHGLWMAEA